MIEREKLVSETLLIIKDNIKDCFGCHDHIFALHPRDEKIANEILEIATKNRIRLSDIEKITVEYLEGKQCPEEHIQEQLEKINEFFKILYE
jgi:hypothetical protein